MDANRLISKAKQAGYTRTALADNLHITRQALYHKLKGNTEFRPSEIRKLYDILQLDNTERDEIFFDNTNQQQSNF